MPKEPPTDGLPELSPEAIVEELRDQAKDAADELNEDMPEKAFELGVAKKWRPQDMLEWWAADCIEKLLDTIKALRPK